MLSDEEIHGIFYPMGTASEAQLQVARACTRAIESAATAPLLARIAEMERLTRELEEARKDAGRYHRLRDDMDLPYIQVWHTRDDRDLRGADLDTAIDAAIKEQT